MGEILNFKPVKEKIIQEVLVDEDEHLVLKGYMDKVYFFSEKDCKHKTTLLRRGHKNGATYIKIPNCLKSRKKFSYSTIKSQKIEEDSKVYYIFTLNKE